MVLRMQVTLLTQHLVRVLRVASSLQVLDAGTFAIQVCAQKRAQSGFAERCQARKFGCMPGSCQLPRRVAESRW